MFPGTQKIHFLVTLIVKVCLLFYLTNCNPQKQQRLKKTMLMRRRRKKQRKIQTDLKTRAAPFLQPEKETFHLLNRQQDLPMQLPKMPEQLPPVPEQLLWTWPREEACSFPVFRVFCLLQADSPTTSWRPQRLRAEGVGLPLQLFLNWVLLLIRHLIHWVFLFQWDVSRI